MGTRRPTAYRRPIMGAARTSISAAMATTTAMSIPTTIAGTMLPLWYSPPRWQAR